MNRLLLWRGWEEFGIDGKAIRLKLASPPTGRRSEQIDLHFEMTAEEAKTMLGEFSGRPTCHRLQILLSYGFSCFLWKKGENYTLTTMAPNATFADFGMHLFPKLIGSGLRLTKANLVRLIEFDPVKIPRIVRPEHSRRLLKLRYGNVEKVQKLFEDNPFSNLYWEDTEQD